MALSSIFALPAAAVALAEASDKDCHGVKVHWVSAAKGTMYQTDPSVDMVMDGGAEAFSPVAGERLSKMMRIYITGPMVAEADFISDVDLSCADSGLVVTVILMRPAIYTGDADGASMRPLIVWKPHVELWVTLSRPETSIEGRWVMKRTDGTVVSRAKMEQLPEQAYPVKVRAKVRANGELTLIP